jgi:hypothetical protein
VDRVLSLRLRNIERHAFLEVVGVLLVPAQRWYSAFIACRFVL